MKSVFSEIDKNRTIAVNNRGLPNGPNGEVSLLLYPMQLKMFGDYKVTLKKLAQVLEYFDVNSAPPRPDDFRLLPAGKYHLLRFLSLSVPFVAIFTSSKFLPQFTTKEQGIYKISKLLGLMSTFLCTIGVVALTLCLTNNLKTIGWEEIVSFYLIILVSNACQAARESLVWTVDGHVASCETSLQMSLMKYVDIDVCIFENGDDEGDGLVIDEEAIVVDLVSSLRTRVVTRSRLDIFIQMFSVLDHNVFGDVLYWLENQFDTPHLYAYKQSQKVRSSVVQDAVEQHAIANVGLSLTKHELHLDQKFNVAKFNSANLLPFFIGLAVGIIPTCVGFARSGVDGTAFGGVHSTTDVIVEVAFSIGYIILFMFIHLVQIKGSIEDIFQMNSLARCLLLLLSTNPSAAETTKYLGKRTSGTTHPPTMRLNTVNGIEGFANLYKFVYKTVIHSTSKRLRIFQVLFGYCIIAAGAVLASSLLELEFREWNVMLFVMGLLFLVYMIKGLLFVISTHTLLTSRIVKALHTQLSMNFDELAHLTGRNDPDMRRELELANAKISALTRDIVENHPPSKLFGFLPLNRNNTVKTAGKYRVELIFSLKLLSVSYILTFYICPPSPKYRCSCNDDVYCWD